MKKWIIRSATGCAEARLVRTSSGSVRVPGRGTTFAELTEAAAAEVRLQTGASVVPVRVKTGKRLKTPPSPPPEPPTSPSAGPSVPTPKPESKPKLPVKKRARKPKGK